MNELDSKRIKPRTGFRMSLVGREGRSLHVEALTCSPQPALCAGSLHTHVLNEYLAFENTKFGS